jgi:hypothetical protein
VSCVAQGSNTNATISYTYTGLTEKGNLKNEVALNDMFASELKDWEAAINHYLETGTQLR